MESKFSEIVAKLDQTTTSHSLTSQPNCNPNIRGVAPIDQAKTGNISYIEGPKFAAMVGKTSASALILPEDESLQQQAIDRGIAWIATPNPRLMFAQAINLFYQPFLPSPGIHPSAVIDTTTVMGEDVSIGPHVVIYPGVTLGSRVGIYGNVVIYPGVTIGDGTILHANCTIHERTQIGANCVIHSSAVIGAEGFGFVPTAEGWYKMEQAGITVLEDGVEVGCSSAIDRPAVGETRIGKNTKIDNQVHIGHGCQVGSACAFAGQVGLAGGVKVGNRVILAGQVGVANQAKIGEGAIAAAQTATIDRELFNRVWEIHNNLQQDSQLIPS